MATAAKRTCPSERATFLRVQTVELVAAILAVVGLVAYPIVIRIVEGGVPQGVKEEQAREYYDQHGRWPDEEPPVGQPAEA